MNSANSETRNNTANSHRDQYPRRLALKLRQRRLLIGEMRIFSERGGAATPSGVMPAVSCTLRVTVASISDFPRLEIDARIDPGIGQVGNQRHDQADERKDVERGEHH